MLHLFRFAVAAAVAGLAIAAGAVTPGQAAPAFKLEGVSAPIALEALRGRHVYLDFWASWCAPCKVSFPWLNSVKQRWPELEIVAINVDRKREDAERFLKSTPARFTVAFDPEGRTPSAYAIKTMPTAMLIGPDGRVLWTHQGFREKDIPELEAKLQAALKGG